MPNQQPSAERRASVDPASPVRPHAAALPAAEKSSLDTVGHSGSVTNDPRPIARARGGRGSSFLPDSGAGANERMAMQGSGVGAHSHSGPGRPNAAPHGSALPDSPSPARPISSDDDDDQLSGMGAVAWVVGAVVCVGGVLAGYLALAAIWGPA